VVIALFKDVVPKKRFILLYLIAIIHHMAAMVVLTKPPLRFSKLDFVDQTFSKMSTHMFEYAIDFEEPKT